MKKKIFVCAFIAICLSIVAYSTTAYFTYSEIATNVITMGNIRIDLQELAVPKGGGDPVPFRDVLDVLPGTEVSKIVQVKNIGVQPAWIRISLAKGLSLAEGIEGEADTSLFTFDINTEYWLERDGYYYYKDVLSPGQTTEPLFTEVRFSSYMGNMYQQSKATVYVNAQATQVVHNGSTVFEAAGWPKAEW